MDNPAIRIPHIPVIPNIHVPNIPHIYDPWRNRKTNKKPKYINNDELFNPVLSMTTESENKTKTDTERPMKSDPEK